MKQFRINSRRGKLVLAATILASGLSFLFGSAILIALPAIQNEFNSAFSSIQWIVNSYTLAIGALILISGSLADRYGRKKIFSLGILVFSSGLLLSGFAFSLTSLIIFQAIIGIGAAMMIPSSLAIINTCFNENERGQAIGLWAGIATGIAAFGPLIGGALVDFLGWRSMFFSFIPIALTALIMNFMFIPKIKPVKSGRIDLKGTFAIALALLGITFGLIQGPDIGWTNVYVTSSILIGIISFLTFIFIERKTSNPLVPLSIFKSPLVSGANLSTLFLYFILGGTLFFVNLNLQQVQGLSPFLTGLALIPSTLIIAIMSKHSGKIADKIGPRIPMITGSLIVSFSMVWMAFAGSNSDYFVNFFPALVLLGIGMGLIIPSLTKSAMSVKEKYSGVASGVNNAISRVAWFIAVAVLGVIAIMIFSATLADNLNSSELSKDIQNKILSQKEKFGDINLPNELSNPEKQITKNIINNSITSGFRGIMIINALLAIIASLIAFFVIRKQNKN